MNSFQPRIYANCEVSNGEELQKMMDRQLRVSLLLFLFGGMFLFFHFNFEISHVFAEDFPSEPPSGGESGRWSDSVRTRIGCATGKGRWRWEAEGGWRGGQLSIPVKCVFKMIEWC